MYKALLKCWLRVRDCYWAKLCPMELHFISISKGNIINLFTGNSEGTAFTIWPIFWITEYALVCGSVLKSICGYIYYNSFFFSTCIESERGKVNWCNLIKSQCKCRDCQEISYASDFWHFKKKYWLSFSHLPGAGEWRNFWSNNLLCLYRFTEAFMNIAQSLLTLAAWYVITLFHTETRRANLAFCSKP